MAEWSMLESQMAKRSDCLEHRPSATSHVSLDRHSVILSMTSTDATRLSYESAPVNHRELRLHWHTCPGSIVTSSTTPITNPRHQVPCSCNHRDGDPS